MKYFKYYLQIVFLLLLTGFTYGIIIPFGVSVNDSMIVIATIILCLLTMFLYPYYFYVIVKKIIKQVKKDRNI